MKDEGAGGVVEDDGLRLVWFNPAGNAYFRDRRAWTEGRMNHRDGETIEIHRQRCAPIWRNCDRAGAVITGSRSINRRNQSRGRKLDDEDARVAAICNQRMVAAEIANAMRSRISR